MRSTFKILLALVIILNMTFVPGFGNTDVIDSNSESELFKGIWVATVYNIDYPKKGTKDSEVLKAEAIEILNKAKDSGMNAVLLQVRPASDAFYKSEIFPWSRYLTGEQGLAPSSGFDPLEFWIEEAHKRDMELHAWINPYRVTKNSKTDKAHDYGALAPNNPARLNPQLTVKHSDGNIYFDPGIPEARELIVKGVVEIVKNYNVDGIHFDDYFYPGQSFEDGETFKKYGGAFKSISDFRRNSVDLLIEDVYKSIKAINSNVEFGVSPFGIWANRKDNSKGSDTNGLQAYYSHYADSKGWVEKEIIDYIAPQIYWNIGFNIADYEKLLKWWSDVCEKSNVKLYIGHAAYRTGNSDSKSPWYGVEEIKRQLEMNDKLGKVQGSIFYNYSAFARQKELGELTRAYFSNGIAPRTSPIAEKTHKLILSRPSSNVRTTASNYYLSGASNSKLPLYLNGELVNDRTYNGFFGVYVPLKNGTNTFTFKQGDESVTRTITKTTGSSSGSISPMTSYKISESTVFPQNREMRLAGETITLTCKAPIGAVVNVIIDGKSYEMIPNVKKSSDGKVYATTYKYEFLMPELAGGAYEKNFGKPKYTMSFKGQRHEVTSPENIILTSSNSIYTAEAKGMLVDLYNTPATGNGVAANYIGGMTDQITGMTGNFVRLSSGYWGLKSNFNIVKNNQPLRGQLTKIELQNGAEDDRIVVTTPIGGAATVSYDGKNVIMRLENIANSRKLILDGILSELPNGKVQISYAQSDIKGYYVEKTADGFSLVIRKNIAKGSIELPLKGYVILLDPGHGGSDAGARGLLGDSFTEKTINLNIAFNLKERLEKLGATVEMTRTKDVDMSLKERLEYSLKIKPDLFLSIHADSIGDDRDISKIHGFSAFYKEPMAKALSERLLNQVISDLNRKNRGSNQKNFYVVRGTWAPSVLIETGFVVNPSEYEWLIDEKSQGELTDSLAKAIVNYFDSRVSKK